MKLTFILLTSVALQVSARGYTQSITLSVKDAPLAKVFESIKQQSGYRFFYNEEQLQKSRPVTIQVKETSLLATLDLVLKDQPFTYSIVNKVIVIKEKINDLAIQTPLESFSLLIDVKGRITNEKGEPVIATVTVKGTNKAVSTNDYGEFEIKGVEENATLVISGVSIETYEVKVNGRSDLAVIKVSAKVTEEEVVTISTGYQQISKERATGSFAQIDNKVYNQQVGTNALSRLEYITNGLSVISQRISSQKDILIRGQSTIQGPKKPLIILDNFPYEGDINNINPNDIENLTILKDAAAASIWGTRAGNGVIVITTKKGRFNTPTKIEFNSNVTIAEKTNLFAIKNISSPDFIEVEKFLFNNDLYVNYEQDLDNSPPLPQVIELLIAQRDGPLSPIEADSKINALKNGDVRNDFSKYFYRNAINQQYAINVRGGSNNTAWILSAGYDKNLSDVYEKFDRINLRSDNTFKIFTNLQLNAGIVYSHTKSTNGRPRYGDLQTPFGIISPYSQFADADEKQSPIYINYREKYLDTAGAGKLLDWKYYPLDDYKHIKNTASSHDVIAKLGLNYNFFNNLIVQFNYQYERQQTEIRKIQDINSYYARDLINSFSQIDWSTGQVTYIVPKGGILDMTNEVLESHNFRGQINYNKSWLKHEIVSIAGAEARQDKTTGNTYRAYGYDDDILTSVNVDYTRRYLRYKPNYEDFIPNFNDFSGTFNRFISFFANGAYSYNKRYTISGSARRDGSNLFGLNTNDKWTPLWSAGASWDVSNEPFYKVSFLPFLKLRATYGFRGNVDPGKSAVSTISYLGVSPYTLSPYSRVNNFYNQELRWEKVGMLNLGLDFRTKNNRVTGSMEYYQKKMDDLYAGDLVDPTAGLNTRSIIKNAGSMKGNGIDIELRSLNIDRSIKWSSDIIFNTYNDKVTQLYQSSDNGANYAGVTQARLVGYPLYSLFAYRWAGLDPLTGDPQGYLNGQTSKDYSEIRNQTKFSDLKYIGSNLPTVFGSIGNTIAWRDISLTVRIVYKLGYYFRRESIDYYSLFYQSRGHSDFELRWQNPGDEVSTNVPSMIYPNNSLRDFFYRTSEVLSTKGDHIRLQYINLSYDLNRNSVKKLPFEQMQIYGIINNLGIIWRANKQNVDPDYSNLSIPASKNFSIGFKTHF